MAPFLDRTSSDRWDMISKGLKSDEILMDVLQFNFVQGSKVGSVS